MSCIKNGVYVHFENYGFYVIADLYQIDPSFYIIRYEQAAISYTPERTPTGIVRYIVNSGDWFHRPDLGVTIVHARDFILDMKQVGIPA